MLKSLSVISVIGRKEIDIDRYRRAVAILEKEAAELDFVLVAKSFDLTLTLKLKALVREVPDTTVLFLAGSTHDDVARLVGIENSIGDYILFCDMFSTDTVLLSSLLLPLKDGYDLVLGDVNMRSSAGESICRQSLIFLFGFLCRAVASVELERRPTGIRVLSREAALFLINRHDAELLIRARGLGNGFAATSVPMKQANPRKPTRSSLRYCWTKGLSMLLSVSTLPLRGASYAAVLGGILSFVYSLYVTSVFCLKRDVAPGWTTISLLLAAMMFIFSVALLFISEYIIQIYSASPPRSRRYLVRRELRSSMSRRSMRLNIVDAEGEFQLGKPHWLAQENEARVSIGE
jgi:hypothetical protein